MRQPIYLVIVASLLLSVKAAASEEVGKSKYILCNPANATETTKDLTGCPKGSNCIDNGTKESFCVCSSNFTVNSNYSSTGDSSQHLYCVEKVGSPHPTQPTSIAPSTTKTAVLLTTTETAFKATTMESAKIPSTSAQTPNVTPGTTNDVKNAPSPNSTPHQHIFGGILLPIFVVLGFIVGVFFFKKYDLVDRFRSRNQQTRYNGLMENDFDDDPLLI